jgi:two-component system chemotaxis sensor kinase CheA
MERTTRDLQERVLSIRMVPVGVVLNRFPRMVRELAGKLGKQVEIELVGEDTELDKSVVELITDPLTHLVRNAVDHGLEQPADRVAAGKPAFGTLTLAASHQSGSIVIEVRDDGRGLDVAKIRKKAIEAGLVSPTEELSEAATYALILRPGFSTADTVSDISGRGVGLDVVKRNLEALHGSVQISSTPGQGASFRITLPLTLAILDGLSLRVGNEAYVLPLATIVESMRVRPEQHKRVLGRGELIDVRGESLPLVRLHRLFAVDNAVEAPTDGLVVVVEHGGSKVGILVDEITGQPQVVIKSLETHYKKVEGLMGATILGDGHVTLILDVPGLIRQGHRTARQGAAA